MRWRVLARLERRQGGLGRGSDSWTYALDTAGQRLGTTDGGARRPHLPGRPMWAHALATAEAYTRLIETIRGTGRALETWHGEPACWRDFAGTLGEGLRLKPDAYVVVAGPDYADVAFVETDTGSQSRTVIRAKLAAYRHYAATGQEQATGGGVLFPRVVFVAPDVGRRDVLQGVIDELPPETKALFVAGLTSDAGQLLTGSEVTP